MATNKTPEFAFEHAQVVLRKLEKKRKSRIFVYVDVGQSDHICYGQRNAIFARKSDLKNIDRLEVLMHSGGGHAEYAYQIARLFRRRCKEFNILVPLYAKSAATLMCLAADNIVMGERSELGPLDVQITDLVEKGLRTFSPIDEFKSMEYLKEYAISILDYYASALVERSGMSLKEAFHEAMPAVTNMMAPLYQKVDPSKIGSYRQSLAIGQEYAKRLLDLRGSLHSEKIAEDLVWKYPSHDFVIDRLEAKNLGLPVTNLSEDEDAACLEIISNIHKYGESVYALTKSAQPKRKATKRVSGGKSTAAAAAKAATGGH
jgi:hypothetical protein